MTKIQIDLIGIALDTMQQRADEIAESKDDHDYCSDLRERFNAIRRELGLNEETEDGE